MRLRKVAFSTGVPSGDPASPGAGAVVEQGEAGGGGRGQGRVPERGRYREMSRPSTARVIAHKRLPAKNLPVSEL
jgi:hypothetical protein